MMEKKQLRVKGMTCDHCRQRITKALLDVKGIKDVKVDLDEGIVTFGYSVKKVNEQNIKDIINQLGYKVSNEKQERYLVILITFISIIVLYFLLKQIIGFDFIYLIPSIDSKVSFSMLFIIGVITSFHCVFMCGGILLTTSLNKTKSYKKPLLYNLGRVISYTILGGIVGFLGSILSIHPYLQFTLIFMAAIFMIIMGISMLDIISFKLSIKMPKINKKMKSPFLIGLLNGFMPCGALQSMQIYAISTGSFLLGALSMFLFALGTVPLMLVIGFVFNALKGKILYIFKIVGAVIVIMLSIIMLNRAFTFLGIDLSYNKQGKNVAEIRDGYQYVEVNVKANSYEDIIVEKGIPVKFVLNVSKENLNGCNKTIIIKEYNIKKTLKVGENVIEFIPNETGDYLYTCWMNMIISHIIVVDNIDGY